MLRKLVARIVDTSGRHPYLIVFCTLCALASTWWYAGHLELHSDIRELLPRDSPGFKAFEHQLGRVGGGATLIVIAQSPSREANRKYIDDLGDALDKQLAEKKVCTDKCADGTSAALPQRGQHLGADAKCAGTCGAQLIGYVERGTKDVRKFFEDNKFLYADLDDLKKAEKDISYQIAIRTDVEDLDAPTPAPGGGAKADPEKKAALGLDEYRDRWKAKANKHDDFPTGYFETEDGGMVGLRIISQTTGTGDSAGDRLLVDIEKLTAGMNPSGYDPQMQIGLAGDIPNAVAEKDSIVGEAALASGIGFLLIMGGIVFFYRKPLLLAFMSLPVIALPALVGVGFAYAFAMFRYGYVNTSGAFLGIIILGNGINYPIVLLARYREFRARGMVPDVARREAVWNAFRAELVGACVGSIAYGSLTITRFRGFSQFGMIGFVGMVLVWASMIPVVPAMLVIFERLQERLPAWMKGEGALSSVPQGDLAEGEAKKLEQDYSTGPLMRFVAKATEKKPWIFLSLAAMVSVAAAVKLPKYLHDPWEYNFDNLGSRGSKHGGAGEWSNKAEKVFGGKMNIAGALMLADSPEQVPLLKAQILKNDSEDPQGKLVAEVATVADLLPGTEAEQKAKLKVLDKIRDHLRVRVHGKLEPSRVVYDLPPEERTRVDEVTPPEDLHVLTGKDLPPLLRRRFEENSGVVGTVFYVKYYNFAMKQDISHSDGHILLRIAKSTDNVKLEDGTVVQTASRATIFAEMIRSMERDGPLATFASFFAVMVVVVLATRNVRGAVCVLVVLVMGVLWTIGGAGLADMRLNFLNFIALPITFGIGCEYPFNVYDRTRLLNGDISAAVKRTGGAVALCSYTTVIGYSSLLFADNQALQSFGQLAMSGEIACIIGALLVLPALLHVTARVRVPPREASGRA